MTKIFVISLHRCATQSTGLFIRNAGFSEFHGHTMMDGIDYQSKIVGSEADPNRIAEILKPILDAFDVFGDVPIPAIYQQLDAAYPDAKFIAVHRNPFDWVRSVREHCGSRPLEPYERAQYWRYLDDEPTTLDSVTDTALVAMYLRHYQEILRYFEDRGNFLLVDLDDVDIGQKLASFLKVAPAKFPHYDYKKDPGFGKHRFHVLGIPYAVSTSEYNLCAFTQKVVRLCAMLKMRGHHVIHYGHEDSRVVCDEHVTVTTNADLARAYGDHDWRTQGFPPYKTDDHAFNAFYQNTIRAVADRKQQHDFLLCSFGWGHKPVADQHGDMIVCEPGIGYAGGHFAPFKVFESYAILHAYYGLAKIAEAANDMWYDVVIPNYFDLSDFEYCDQKDDYFLFLGRIIPGKGVNIVAQVVDAIGGRLVVAGPGSIEHLGEYSSRLTVEHVGVADMAMRKKLMSKAKAMLLPSLFAEPFCGVHVESMLSGTPVITTDWGAFTEYNIHGVTGYRCRTFEQFVWAAKNIGTIRPAVCRDWAAANFSMDRVAEMYDEYWYGVKSVFTRGGWYAANPERKELNWLTKYWPGVNAFAAASSKVPR